MPVYFFLKIAGNPRLAAGLFFVLVVFSTIPAYSKNVTLDGSLTWWDWTVFGLGASFFLSLGAMLLAYFFESELKLCGEPGFVPGWASFFGITAAEAISVPAQPIYSSPPLIHKPKAKLFPFVCRNCGADSEIAYVGSPCPYCGEVPPASNKRSLFKGGSAED